MIKPENPCWECDVREVEVNDRYCKVCNEKSEWINDFYEQFEDQTMVQNSRKVRGRRTEHVVANYFAERWGSAKVVNSGASGSDVVGTPFDIEEIGRAHV